LIDTESTCLGPWFPNFGDSQVYGAITGKSIDGNLKDGGFERLVDGLTGEGRWEGRILPVLETSREYSHPEKGFNLIACDKEPDWE
jgi:hypothetical protein